MCKKIVIGIAGMPGAGKATAEEALRQRGYPIIVMGDEVREEAKRRNLDPTPENLGKIMLEIRDEEGSEVLARRCIPKIMALDSNIVGVDGIRSLQEVEEYRKVFQKAIIIAVHASPKTRFRRLLARGRRDDPEDWAAFIARDRRELVVGLGEVIATADYMVINEGRKSQTVNVVNRILSRCLKNERGRC